MQADGLAGALPRRLPYRRLPFRTDLRDQDGQAVVIAEFEHLRINAHAHPVALAHTEIDVDLHCDHPTVASVPTTLDVLAAPMGRASVGLMKNPGGRAPGSEDSFGEA